MPSNNAGIVRVTRGGNAGQKISFQYEDGKSDTGIAATSVTTGWATFVRPYNGKIEVYGERPSERVLVTVEGGQILEEEVLEVETLLPFIVLGTSALEAGDNVQIGGDRNQVIVATAGNVLKAGISNRGNLEYISVWLDASQLTKDDNGVQTISAFPPFLNPDDFFWVGNGLLNANLFTAFPEDNKLEYIIKDPLFIELQNFDPETGDELEPTRISFEPPLYPKPNPFRFDTATRSKGITILTQDDDGYDYKRIEKYKYKYVIGGDAGLDPNIEFPGSICGFGVFAEIIRFLRESGMEYERCVREELTGTAQTLFNDQVYSGERNQLYEETYIYTQTTAVPFNPDTAFDELFDTLKEQLFNDPEASLFELLEENAYDDFFEDADENPDQNLAEKFSVASYFQCVNLTPGFFPGVYVWVYSQNRDGIFRGENHITDKDCKRTITEPEWDKPITLGVSRTQKHLLVEITTEDTDLLFKEETWSVNPASVTFQYPKLGFQISTKIIDYNEERIRPTTLIISADGSSALFTEREEKEISLFTQYSETFYTKYNDIDIIFEDPLARVEVIDNQEVLFLYPELLLEEPVPDPEENPEEVYFDEPTFTQNKVVTEKVDIEKFYLLNGGQITEITVDDNWVFNVITEDELSTGTITLSNDDDTPIFTGNLNRITSYVEDKDLVIEASENVLTNPPGNQFLFYSDVEEEELAYWSNIEQEPVFLQSGANRYLGIVIDYDYTDEPDENLPIQIKRKVTSITIAIDAIEGYPVGIAEENEIVIYPRFNCSKLVRDRLLQEGNRELCNIVLNQLFFSGSVPLDLSAGEQQTEVYTIGEVITQDGAQSGAFLPMAAIDTVLGVSYFPQ